MCRRIDDLGRVVIPKEIRRTMRIREGDPLRNIHQLRTGRSSLRKYSPIGEIAGVRRAVRRGAVHKLAGLPAIVCDRDHVIAVSGIPKKELLERRVTPALEELADSRKSTACTSPDSPKVKAVEGVSRYAVACSPIIASGDVAGSILLISGNGDDSYATDVQVKLVQAAAAFLGKQMEE